jgi:hypothetical protein
MLAKLRKKEKVAKPFHASQTVIIAFITSFILFYFIFLIN